MADVDFLRRIEMLESTVESLRALPGEMRQLGGRVDRLESQFVQLRTEMRDEFSAIRRDMATKEDLAAMASKADLAAFATKADLAAFATKADLAAFATKEDLAGMATKANLAAGLDALRNELHEDIAGAVRELSGAITETRQEIVAHTRALIEDVISRIKVLGEGRN
jgi:hypothetical protein